MLTGSSPGSDVLSKPGVPIKMTGVGAMSLSLSMARASAIPSSSDEVQFNMTASNV